MDEKTEGKNGRLTLLFSIIYTLKCQILTALELNILNGVRVYQGLRILNAVKGEIISAG